MNGWIRRSTIGPDLQPLSSCDIDDGGWYAAGGHFHPSQWQLARDELACAELQEWLERARPTTPGAYVIWGHRARHVHRRAGPDLGAGATERRQPDPQTSQQRSSG